MTEPWLLKYTAAVLAVAAGLLGLELPASASKAQIVGALNQVEDREAVGAAVASASGVAHKAALVEAGELEPDTPPSDFDMDSYLKSELKEAALSLDISISWSYTKVRIIEELKGYPDQMAVYQAVIAAAGE